MSNTLKHDRRGGVILTAALVVGAMAAEAQGQCEVALLSPSKDANDFGRSVSVFGDVAVVGDPGIVNKPVGSATVFRYDGTQWLAEAQLRTPAKQMYSDVFGRAVAISGDLIVVGAPNADAPEFSRGVVHIFRYDTDSLRWGHEATLTASDGAGGDRFGWSVAIDLDGDLLLIGARDDENGEVSQSGSAYVFRYNPDTSAWVEEAKLTDPEGQELDLFGQSVAIRGDEALIGAHGNDDAAPFDPGAAFVFRFDGTAWILEAKLTAFDATSNDLFGWSVSLASDVALVGARGADGQNGAAYVFRYDPDSSAWQHEIKLSASEPIGVAPGFAHSLSLDANGDKALIGASGDGDAGAAYLFRDDGTGWVEVAKLTPSDAEVSGIFGTSVAISGDVGFVGAPCGDVPGKAYLFNLDPTSGDLDCDGTVGIIDLLILLSEWGQTDSSGDLNDDGIVNVFDLLILLANWG